MQIDHDLRHWKDNGISAALMDWLVVNKSISWHGQKAIGIMFKGGVPFVLSNLTYIYSVGHHAQLLVGHMMLFEALSKRFGSQIPDVEFLISSFDVPQVLIERNAEVEGKKETQSQSQELAPILRFCSSSHHADILVPDIHFQTKRFNHTLLANVASMTPWEGKAEKLFGRFSTYKRIVHYSRSEGGGERKPLATIDRLGSSRQPNICKVADHEFMFCTVRETFMSWTRQRLQEATSRETRIEGDEEALLLDVAKQPKVKQLDQSKFKWLLHLDGQSCSSRLEQIMTMGSLIFKEESGYYPFFHRLLRPLGGKGGAEDGHYLPVWRQGEGPESVLGAIKWAKENQEKAREAAERSRELAKEIFSPSSLACYWLVLFDKLSPLLKFKVGPENNSGGTRTAGRVSPRYLNLQPVQQFLQSSVGQKYTKAGDLNTIEL